MKTALPSRFIRSSRHIEAEPCRNCGTVYFGNYCNECGQDAYTGAPTAMGFIYEFLTRNLFERGKVHRTLWRLVRHPGALTVDFLEGRRQRFIRPVRLYFILSVMYFLLLSFQNSSIMRYVKDPAPESKVAERAVINAVEKPLLGTERPKIVMGPITINPDVPQDGSGQQKKRQPILTGIPYEKELQQYPWWQEFRHREQAFSDLSQEERNKAMGRIMLGQAPKAMFFLVPVFALFMKGLFVFRRIPYGAHLLFSFHYHCYVFLMLLLMQLPIHELFTVIMGFSMAWYLIASMRKTYETGWITATLRAMVLATLYSISMAFCFLAALIIGFLL